MSSKDKSGKIKEVIKQCLREVLVEEGLLSEVLAEGIRKANISSPAPQPMIEAKAPTRPRAPSRPKFEKSEAMKALEQKFAGTPMQNIFEGVEAIPGESTASPLSGLSKNDPGIDITKFPGFDRWKDKV